MKIFSERINSPRLVGGDNPTREYLYSLWDDDPAITITEAQAEEHVRDNTPSSRDGLNKRVIVINADDELGDKLWRVEVRYSKPQPAQTDTPSGGSAGRRVRIGFDRQRVFRSISTVGTYAAPGETAPDFGKQIGVTQNGVSGVDVVIPAFKFTRHRTISAAEYTEAYENTLFNLAGRVNKTTFTGKAPGTVLFVGADSQYNFAEDEYEITLEFEANQNEEGIVIGDITGISKGGWEYLWVYYEDVEDEDSGRTIKKPVAAYVEQIAKVGELNALGVGT